MALANFPKEISLQAVGPFLQTMSSEVEKQAITLANFPTDSSSWVEVGPFLHTMRIVAEKHAIALAKAEKHANTLAYFPTDQPPTAALDVGLFLQTMSTSGGNGIEGLVGYILKFV